MLEFLANYGLFLLKTVTFVVAILIVFAGLVAIGSKSKSKGELQVKKCNDHYDRLLESLRETVLSKTERKQQQKATKKQAKSDKKTKSSPNKKRLFILTFNGDIKASSTDQLREEINAILLIATPNDEVVLKLESPGGMVPHYGLAASQLQRLRDQNIPLTVIVDKMAASGGYLMASIANRILAAPFAIIGSIGVVAQLPNFHRFLKKHNIDFEQITAGEYKRTLTILGENTKEGRQKFQSDLNDLHELFKDHIQQFRSQLDLEKVATGEYWFGKRALDLALIDGIQTSDDYLLQHHATCDLIDVRYKCKKPLRQRVSRLIQHVFTETRDFITYR